MGLTAIVTEFIKALTEWIENLIDIFTSAFNSIGF